MREALNDVLFGIIKQVLSNTFVDPVTGSTLVFSKLRKSEHNDCVYFQRDHTDWGVPSSEYYTVSLTRSKMYYYTTWTKQHYNGDIVKQFDQLGDMDLTVAEQLKSAEDVLFRHLINIKVINTSNLPKNGVVDNVTREIYEDSEDNLWIKKDSKFIEVMEYKGQLVEVHV